jgi:hypothetical protein
MAGREKLFERERHREPVPGWHSCELACAEVEPRQTMNCQIEFVSSDSDVGAPCGNTAVTKCSDCGVAICSDCRMERCGHSFCELCYDYHVTHFCLRKPVQNVPTISHKLHHRN